MAETTEQDDIRNVLASLIEQARALATRVAGDPEGETECHFCEGPLPLWENLLVLQLTGVAAHVECPGDRLAARLKRAAPDETFAYDEFSKAVDRRRERTALVACSGTIELPDPR